MERPYPPLSCSHQRARHRDTLRYDEFRDLWEEAIREAGFPPLQLLRTETIDPTRMSRRHEFPVGHDLPQEAEPFHVTRHAIR